MKMISVAQRTPEWYAARAGKPTASGFDRIVTSDGKPSKQAQKYMYQLAGEKILGMPEETYQNAAMQRGVELEAEARQYYELVTGTTVQEVGFCLDDTESFGCSPDGLVGEDGLIEIKCPSLAVHVDYLLRGALPSDYIQQVQGQLLVTGRKWCDFVSYYPGIRPLVVRVARNEDFIKKLSVELELFCADLKTVINKIQ
jgi:putative phage-type endonuclease